jgi:hypothetical protein
MVPEFEPVEITSVDYNAEAADDDDDGLDNDDDDDDGEDGDEFNDVEEITDEALDSSLNSGNFFFIILKGHLSQESSFPFSFQCCLCFKSGFGQDLDLFVRIRILASINDRI